MAAPRDRRRDILEAALACFTARGLHATTMDDIRVRSGASTGSIYHHFASKEQLAAALYVEALRDYQAGFVAALAPRASAERAVKAAVAFHIRWVERRPDWARYLLDIGRHSELMAATQGDVQALNAQFRARVETWMAGHVARGEIAALPADLYFAIVVGPAHQFARMWLAGMTQSSIATAARTLGAAAWQAVRAEPSSAVRRGARAR